MFCPSCKDEFRAGFTRCANCDVDLVEDPSAVQERPAAQPPRASGPVPVADYCGFLDLDEARSARDRLRGEGIRSDILIREAPGSAPDVPVAEEEYWLRVETAQYRRVPSILGFDAADEEESSAETETHCDSCGAAVAAEETFCANCGARFEGS